MTLDEALQFADQWAEGHTFYEGSQGWRVVCAVLAAEVRRLRSSSEPLTDAELVNCYLQVSDKEWAIGGMEDAKVFARAIEKAHGIGAGE